MAYVYLSTVSRPGLTKGVVGGNVLALGTVSLITDVSSEMITAVLPIYLVVGLHLSPLAFGVLDGVYTGATAVVRVAGGYVADRVRGRKLVAGLGYGLSAVMKLGLLLAGRSVGALGVVIAADRLGKGLRTAPRDALISLSVPPDQLGRAFGVHRMMDGAGAFLGPLVALGVLFAAGGEAYDAVFVASFCVAALGVVVLVLFVREHPAPVAPVVAAPRTRPRISKSILGAACLLGLATIGDGFVYLLLQRGEDLDVRWFPLLAVGTSLTYLLLAAPLGRLADRVGRLPVVAGGYLALAATYLLLAGPGGGWQRVVLVLGCYGLFYAATDGVLMALVAPTLPERLRTTGLALVQTGQALAYLVSSVLFGAAWQLWGPDAAIRSAAALAVVAVIATVFLLRVRKEAR
ncbi:MFS transporter [Actinoplanes sp. NBRC 103695]|uniref:MFS transporter n=1 Tax=Actinoplanes sp. NBRC 103695 TaxID=3032202 RepID=UPI0024A48BAE|nr:MFS transporter [Actinoplanes sp. NBRC 103695]GLY92841.1 MFS transporter [Actinoplanes sp. NBRC 103695]